jgi:hypothetical protein
MHVHRHRDVRFQERLPCLPRAAFPLPKSGNSLNRPGEVILPAAALRTTATMGTVIRPVPKLNACTWISMLELQPIPLTAELGIESGDVPLA